MVKIKLVRKSCCKERSSLAFTTNFFLFIKIYLWKMFRTIKLLFQDLFDKKLKRFEPNFPIKMTNNGAYLYVYPNGTNRVYRGKHWNFNKPKWTNNINLICFQMHTNDIYIPPDWYVSRSIKSTWLIYQLQFKKRWTFWFQKKKN